MSNWTIKLKLLSRSTCSYQTDLDNLITGPLQAQYLFEKLAQPRSSDAISDFSTSVTFASYFYASVLLAHQIGAILARSSFHFGCLHAELTYYCNRIIISGKGIAFLLLFILKFTHFSRSLLELILQLEHPFIFIFDTMAF